jgi:hypothetical protein
MRDWLISSDRLPGIRTNFQPPSHKRINPRDSSRLEKQETATP